MLGQPHVTPQLPQTSNKLPVRYQPPISYHLAILLADIPINHRVLYYECLFGFLEMIAIDVAKRLSSQLPCLINARALSQSSSIHLVRV